MLDSTWKSTGPTVARRIADALGLSIPAPQCALNYRNAFELVVATILSAQCTDARVNEVTPAVFQRYPDAKAMAEANLEELEQLIHSLGFFRAKSNNLKAMAQALTLNHGGQPPKTMEELTLLPGVGRKTANVVLANAFGIATGFVVDTHVKRLAFRLGFSESTNPEIIERDLMKLFPKKLWIDLGHRLILHGRSVCHARKPNCANCELVHSCPRNGVVSF